MTNDRRRTEWSDDTMLDAIEDVILESQTRFADLLRDYVEGDADRRAVYQRYLSFQYHLTRGVQRYFMRVAASPKLARMRRLRKFFTSFANEEELHYLVAASDLRALGMPVLPQPLDVALWHAYFDNVTDLRPFLRVGAALVLENISAGPAREWVTKALTADFLTRENTKFLVLHQHETLPHGDQLIEAVTSSPISDIDVADLLLGARQGMVMYMRMAHWATEPSSKRNIAANVCAPGLAIDASEIETFAMEDLDLED